MTASAVEPRFVSPIAVPGPRLITGVPLKFVRARGTGRRRGVNHELPLIPFIDFLLAVVLFLLGSFSATGDIPVAPGIEIPLAARAVDLVEAPVISVVGNQVLVDGTPAGVTRSVQEANRLQRIDELWSVLSSKRDLWTQLRPGEPFAGSAILQVDRRVPAVVVKSVFQTAALAGYPNLGFTVKRSGG